MTLDIGDLEGRDLMAQAWMTAHEYLRKGVECIDRVLGDGYAAKHPELLAAFMRTAVQDYHSGMMKAGMQDIRDILPRVMDQLVDVIEAARIDAKD